MSMRSFRGARLVRFGAFELDLRAAELRKYGIRIRLQEQPFRILVMLLERPGEIVLREEIRKRLWPNDTVVEVGHGINAAILRLREALGESAENPRYVETVARRGYRFTGETEVILKDETAQPVPAAPAIPLLDTGGLEGKTVSHFAVLEKLGGGGMGIVYRARDLNLGREVALKFLPRELAGDAVAAGRFQREARAASALNHPNVCTVHGVEDCGGQPAIVMELIEGETLAKRLEKGRLPAQEALQLAIQVASALDAAHRKAIVHRDLKPGNLLVTPTGVKVLDFGLAKMGRPAALPSAGRASQSCANLTQFGAVMGTLQYMSPEQVQGRETDSRSDIYSFGLVLYEMLAGCRAVKSEDKPALPELAPHFAPEGLERIVRRCLEWDPEERWQSARDLKAALEWIAHDPRKGAAPSRLRVPGTRKIWAAAALVVIAAALLPEWIRRVQRSSYANPKPAATHPLPVRMDRPNAAMPPMKELPITAAGDAGGSILTMPEGIVVNRIALSPDARNLAFTAGNNLYLRSMQTGAVHLVTTQVTGAPFWSPDAQSIAFSNGRQLKRVSAEGGEAAAICEVNTNIAGNWGPDQTILIGMVGGAIYRVPAAGGIPERVTELNAGREETRHVFPQFLPVPHGYLYVAGSPNGPNNQLVAGSLGSAAGSPIMPVLSAVTFVPRRGSTQGYLLFVKNHDLLAESFDARRRRLIGEPRFLAAGISTAPIIGAAATTAEFSATNELLVFQQTTAGARGLMGGRRSLLALRNWMAALK